MGFRNRPTELPGWAVLIINVHFGRGGKRFCNIRNHFECVRIFADFSASPNSFYCLATDDLVFYESWHDFICVARYVKCRPLWGKGADEGRFVVFYSLLREILIIAPRGRDSDRGYHPILFLRRRAW